MKKPLDIFDALKGKPSTALQHMVNGLLKQSQRKKFEVSMGTYGMARKGICYGCAATCTIQNIANKNLSVEFIKDHKKRAKELKIEEHEILRFEYVMNRARLGELFPLFTFCNMRENHHRDFDYRFSLRDYNWEDELPKVRKTISQLRKAGY